MRLEFIVDGEIVYQETLIKEKLEYRLFHLQALARNKFKKKEWYIFLIKRGHEGGRNEIDVDLNRVESMQRSGLQLQEIASTLNISITTLCKKRNEAGLIAPRKVWDIAGAYKLRSQEGWTLAMIAERYGISTTLASRRMCEMKKKIGS